MITSRNKWLIRRQPSQLSKIQRKRGIGVLRKLGCFVIAFGFVAPLVAADRTGSISGYVRSAAGAPQMGAIVEVIGSAMEGLKVFTDEKGFYSATGLRPGFYS